MSKEKPTTTEEQEKAVTPWRVSFSCGKNNPSYTEIKKDLLIACWGNEKMAHVLYHLLYTGSWKAENNHVDKSERKIVLQVSNADIIKKLGELKFKVKISEPTLINYLKMFAAAGYVRRVARKELLEVNFEAVENAFTNRPDKPLLGKNLSSDLSLSANLKSEVEDLRETVAFLTKQAHDLSLTLVQLKFAYAQIEQEFKLNLSSPLVDEKCDEDATVAALAHIFKFAPTKTFKLKNSSGLALADGGEAQNFPKNILDIRYRDIDKEREEEDGFATATPSRTLPFSEELDILSEDLVVPPSKKSDSHSQPPSETSQSSEQKSDAASDYGKTEETQQTRTRRNRKPTAPKVDMAEVELYLDVFDELYREISKEPETGYGRTGVDREAIIKDLLTPKLTNPKFVTPEKLKAVYRALYKKPKDEKTGFCWADNMSIKAVCRNYAKEAMTLTARAKEQVRNQTQAKPEDETYTISGFFKRQAMQQATAGLVAMEILG